jgi:hypothetical protein
MLLYRSAVLGLLCALALLVAGGREEPRPAAEAPVVVDVSKSALRQAQLPVDALLGLRPGERVVAVAGATCGTETPLADLRWTWSQLSDRGYLDVEVAGRGDRRRRVLVLAHP